ncbi:uncharacterized protein LOC126323743 isoform X2 [Schistocerca gregaria]|nr:uncharacterized protein LOC126323743 isoform X2 [Schistocerca gregaria]XP_049850699.1 uncharacterized protein LOC126323743 isoform X2 [Schistocerca gregaria]XP_049850700.1 uncharacterized protein LOC126323743 isoform X2 [Schistocerca gregaria]
MTIPQSYPIETPEVRLVLLPKAVVKANHPHINQQGIVNIRSMKIWNPFVTLVELVDSLAAAFGSSYPLRTCPTQTCGESPSSRQYMPVRKEVSNYAEPSGNSTTAVESPKEDSVSVMRNGSSGGLVAADGVQMDKAVLQTRGVYRNGERSVSNDEFGRLHVTRTTLQSDRMSTAFLSPQRVNQIHGDHSIIYTSSRDKSSLRETATLPSASQRPHKSKDSDRFSPPLAAPSSSVVENAQPGCSSSAQDQSRSVLTCQLLTRLRDRVLKANNSAEDLLKEQTNLKETQELLTKAHSDIFNLKEKNELLLKNMKHDAKRLEKWLRENEYDLDKESVDRLTDPEAAIRRQYLEVKASDQALSDAQYYLVQAKERELIDTSKFLKAYRNLSTKQFYERALALEIEGRVKNLDENGPEVVEREVT